MKTCPFCAKDSPDEALFCRYCGRKLTAAPTETSQVAGAREAASPTLGTSIRLSWHEKQTYQFYIFLVTTISGLFVLILGIALFLVIRDRERHYLPIAQLTAEAASSSTAGINSEVTASAAVVPSDTSTIIFTPVLTWTPSLTLMPSPTSTETTAAATLDIFALPTATPDIFALPSPTITSVATPAAATTATSLPSGYVYFQDDFTNPVSGWPRIRQTDFITDYQDNSYRMWISPENLDTLAIHPNLTYPQARIQATITNVGVVDNAFGVVCRYTNDKNYYFFVASSDGYFGIGKKVGSDTAVYLTRDPNYMVESRDCTIYPHEVNYIQVDCSNNTLSFYINGCLLASVNDSSLTTGNIGFIARSFDVPGVDVYFDNFKVIKP